MNPDFVYTEEFSEADADNLYLKLDGSNANQTIDIGSNTFTARGVSAGSIGLSVTGNSTFSGEINGSFQSVLVDCPSATATRFFRLGQGNNMDANYGLNMAYDGSVRFLSSKIKIVGHSANGSLAILVYKNGVNVYTSSVLSVTGNGDFEINSDQLRDITSFSQDDNISFELRKLGGTFTFRASLLFGYYYD